MQPPGSRENGSRILWAVVRPEPPGQFTAQVPGLPEIRATATTREDALRQVRTALEEWLASGQLVPLEVPEENPLLTFSGFIDPNDPLEQEYVAELARSHEEDLQRTIREHGLEDQQCPNTSSTPTT